jgi:hypothetical protein
MCPNSRTSEGLNASDDLPQPCNIAHLKQRRSLAAIRPHETIEVPTSVLSQTNNRFGGVGHGLNGAVDNTLFGVGEFTMKYPLPMPIMPHECFDMAAFGDIMGKGAVPPPDFGDVETAIDNKFFVDTPTGELMRNSSHTTLQQSMATLHFPTNPGHQILNQQQPQLSTTCHAQLLSTMACRQKVTMQGNASLIVGRSKHNIVKHRVNSSQTHYPGGRCQKIDKRLAAELNGDILAQPRHLHSRNLLNPAFSDENQQRYVGMSMAMPVMMQTPASVSDQVPQMILSSTGPVVTSLAMGGPDKLAGCAPTRLQPLAPGNPCENNNDAFLRGMYMAMLDATQSHAIAASIVDANDISTNGDPITNFAHKSADVNDIIGIENETSNDEETGEGDEFADSLGEEGFSGIGGENKSSVRDQYDELPLEVRQRIDRLRAKISKMPRRKLRECLAGAVTLEEIEPLMGVNRDDLATMLSLGVTTWKSFVHQELGVSRWPARSLKSAMAKRRDALARLAAAEDGGREGDVAGLRTEVVRLDRARERMVEGLRIAAKRRQEAIEDEKRREEVEAIFPGIEKAHSDEDGDFRDSSDKFEDDCIEKENENGED